MSATGTGVRGRILDAIAMKPGIHMRELSRTVGLSLSGVSHHVRALEEQGTIVGVSDGYYRRFFSSRLVLDMEARRLNESDRRLLAECQRSVSLAIILNLAADGPMRHGQIGCRLRKSKGTVSYHLARLVDTEIVRLASPPSGEAYELADPKRVLSILATFSGSLQDRLDGFARLWLRLRR